MAVSFPHGREKKGSRLILFFVIAMISFFIGWILNVRFLTAAALALYVFSVCGYIYGTCSGVFVYPCFYLIFLYPFEWKLSFYNPLFNRINAKIIKIFFEKLDFPVELSMENITVKVSNFTLILIDRCSGLQVIVLLFMFLSIVPWLNKFNKKQSMVWLLAIPCIVWSVNIIRIFLFTLIGVSEIKALGFMHFLLSLFFLLALYILFRMLFLILSPKGKG